VNLPSPVIAQVVSGSNPGFEVVVFAILFGLLFGWVGKVMVTKEDRKWLPGLVLWAFIVKVVGAVARWYMVAVLYGGGDSIRYHDAGVLFANVWRSFGVPVSTAGGEGTAFTEVATGLIYALYTPSYLGGFVLFAVISFVGQLLFYAAFRPWSPPERLKTYAWVIFFLPSLVFWPSSIGKDAFMVLFLGLASYAASKLLKRYEFGSLFLLAPGLYLASRIRPHVAAILGLSLMLALLLGNPPKKFERSPKRGAVILFSIAGAALAVAAFASTFNVTVEGGDGSQDAGAFLEDVSEQTGQGGSEIEGAAVTDPANLPLAIITVLFRPLIHEGTSPQVILSALEGTALLIFTIWKFPAMWRNKGLLRQKPYLLMCFLYTGGFIIAFSAFQNLGILARQRVQVLPMFLAVIVVLSWENARKKDEAEMQRLERKLPRRLPEKDPAPQPPASSVSDVRPSGNPNGKASRPSRTGSSQGPTDSTMARDSARHQRQ
jgi:hypothetical protein